MSEFNKSYGECKRIYGTIFLLGICELNSPFVYCSMIRNKKVRAGSEIVIDRDTGEIVERNDLYMDKAVKDEDEWFQGFRSLIRAVLNLDGNEVKVLLWCAIEAHIGTNEVVLLRLIKERMALEIGLSMGGIDNALGRLVKKGHLHRLGRGVYHLDPNTTWRGTLDARAKQVNIFLRYTIQNP